MSEERRVLCEQVAGAGCLSRSPTPLLPFPGKATPHAHLSAFLAPTPGGWPAVRVTGILLPLQQWPKGGLMSVWWGQWIFPAVMGQGQ